LFQPGKKKKGWDESFEQWPPPIDARRKMKRGGLMKKKERRISFSLGWLEGKEEEGGRRRCERISHGQGGPKMNLLYRSFDMQI
jgi:hypothetical protein